MKKDKSNIKLNILERQCLKATESAYTKLLSCCYIIARDYGCNCVASDFAIEVDNLLKSGNFIMIDFNRKEVN